MNPQDQEALAVVRRALGSSQFTACLSDHQVVQNALARIEKRLGELAPTAEPEPAPEPAARPKK